MVTRMTSITENRRSCRDRTGSGGDDGSGGKTLRVNSNWPSLPLLDLKGKGWGSGFHLARSRTA
jgi:hypothetical protein